MTTHRLSGLTVAALATCALAACDLPANPRRPQLLTFADLSRLADGDPAVTFANDQGAPGGLRVSDFVTKDDAGYHLTLRDTWTEGYRSAYETAEIWLGFDEVWVQPVYVAITGFTDGKPDLLPDPSATDPEKMSWSPIFSVGPDSAFYSPFWQVFYFKVPVGTDADAYTTAREVIDSGLPLIPGPAHTMSLVPAGETIVPATAGAPMQAVGGPTDVSTGYLDGKDVSFLDFGKDNFSWNDDLVVDATPLFMLVYRDDAGHLQPMHVPTIAGTGPLYANRPPNVSNDVPHYGAFWRLYTVEVPATARIFAPPLPAFAAASADYPPAFLEPESTYGAGVLTTPTNDIGHWLGRVALNAVPSVDSTIKSCFDDYDNLDTSPGSAGPEPCAWLDSQPAVERAVPASSIQPTDVLVTCPFVSYDDQPFVVTP